MQVRWFAFALAALAAAGCGSDSSTEPIADACAATAITIGQTVNGSLTETSCVAADSRRAVFTFDIATEGAYVVETTVPAGEGWCFCVYAADSGFVGSSGYHHFTPGRYQVIVNPRSLTATGAYTLRITPGTVPASCTSNCSVFVGKTANITGTLTSTDRLWLNIGTNGVGTSDGRRMDEFYRFMEIGQTLAISATSTSNIQLESAVAFDFTIAPARSAVGTSVQLSVTATRRDYYAIRVIGASGSYSLTLR